ncbi:MAG TPA: CBS domain-containing protein [Terriglobales bacterium]|nr:CBS domain-containing protein [Terriglobales bacterium]
MGAIYDLVRGNKLVSADQEQTVSDAARLMKSNNVGAVPVLNNGELVGIFSERDIMNRVVAEGLNPQTTVLRDVMSPGPLTVGAQESVENCMVLMKRHGVRHLPIVDGNQLVGMVSLRDILLFEVSEMDGEVRAMRAYIQST